MQRTSPQVTDHDHPDVRRRRLLFRCWHRGTQESDLILGSFAEDSLETLDNGQLGRFEALLDCTDLEPQVTWGTDPSQVVGISGRVPDPAALDPGRRAAAASARASRPRARSRSVSGAPKGSPARLSRTAWTASAILGGSCPAGRAPLAAASPGPAAAVLSGSAVVFPGSGARLVKIRRYAPSRMTSSPARAGTRSTRPPGREAGDHKARRRAALENCGHAHTGQKCRGAIAQRGAERGAKPGAAFSRADSPGALAVCDDGCSGHVVGWWQDLPTI